MSKSRAGRESWQTRVNYTNAIGDVVRAIATAPKPEYDDKTTKAMVIERYANGRKEVITFSQSYGELSMWLGKSFANISEDGFSDMLAGTFLQGATIFTGKAEYRLWNLESFNPCGCHFDPACPIQSYVYQCDTHREEADALSKLNDADCDEEYLRDKCFEDEYFFRAGEIDRFYQEVV